jgi:hypothetical protein
MREDGDDLIDVPNGKFPQRRPDAAKGIRLTFVESAVRGV